MKIQIDLKTYLDEQVEKYNHPTFIATDPICIPHRFTRLQDIEITAFWTAMLAWGQRKTIIAKAEDLVRRMDGAPYDFIVNHLESDRANFLTFKHRTFQPTDTLYFLEFLQWFYHRHRSLEEAFLPPLSPPFLQTGSEPDNIPISQYPNIKLPDPHVGNALAGFHRLFFSLPDAPGRTKKHVPTPAAKSTCKRLNMFLRWMVRRDERGVDFGLWKNIKPSQLLIPLDVHVERIARRFGLLERPQTDWLAVLELTERLKIFDAEDPVRYDFALFGAGVLEKSGEFILQEFH